MFANSLTIHEKLQMRQWARDNYKPFSPIDGTWHPIVQDECVQINRDASGHKDSLQVQVLQALLIRWHEPTDKKPSRYSVKTAASTKFYHKQFALSAEQNARVAAESYCETMGWPYRSIAIGQLHNGDYVAVLLNG